MTMKCVWGTYKSHNPKTTQICKRNKHNKQNKYIRKVFYPRVTYNIYKIKG